MLPLGVLGGTPLSQPPLLSLQLPGQGGTKAACLCLRETADGSALLWKLVLCYRCWAGDGHSAAVSMGTAGNLGILGVTERDPPQTRFEGSAAFSCPA